MFKHRSSSGWKASRGRGRNMGSFRSNNRRGNKPPIDIASFIERASRAEAVHVEDEPVTTNFADFGFLPQLLANISRIGYQKPTPIQEKVFGQINDFADVLGIANTGTGKTGAFLIPLINQLIINPKKKILVIAPTRELAGQINEAFADLTRGLGFVSVQCTGGSNIFKQVSGLSRNFHAVIGTPGRLKDLAKRGNLAFGEFGVIVLDEVDRMLDMGFVHEIRQIIEQTPKNRQSLYFSATVTPRVMQLIEEFSQNVVKVSVKSNDNTGLIDQNIVRYAHDEAKMDKLHDILISEGADKVLIFGRTKFGVKRLMFQLRDRGFRTESIHGNKTQSQRFKALAAFKENKVDILVATDVAARGLDIDNVSHVINYEIPESFDDYIHRIGRTGRGGKQGVAYTFVK